MRDLMTQQRTLCDNSHFHIIIGSSTVMAIRSVREMTKKLRSLKKIVSQIVFSPQNCLSVQLGEIP